MTTLTPVPIDARTMEKQLNQFTLTLIHARDIMVDDHGVLTFFYGPVRRRPGRVEIVQTSPGIYSMTIGHIDPHTHTLIVDRSEHDVPEDALRELVRELT